jgi:subtilisin family serine protease
MSRKNERFTGKDKLSDEVLSKLDPGLRGLLRMSDSEITAEVRKHNRKFSLARRKAISKITEKFTPSTAPEERKLLVRRALQGIIPHPVFAAVIVGIRKPLRIRAIVRFNGNKKDLNDLGIKVGSQSQDVFTIVGTPSQLAALAKQPALRRMRLPRILLPTVENACGQSEVAGLHNPTPNNPAGLLGTGVLIGVIDSSLDVTHHGFCDPTAPHDSRVMYYWVQSTDSTSPPGVTPHQFYNAHIGPPATSPDFSGLDYGRLYTNADINTALGTSPTYGNGNNQIDCNPAVAEHGTHCTGIAAGSGHENSWTAARTHIGAAPGATIIHVRLQSLNSSSIGLDATFEDALLDGIAFCFHVAQFQNMPMVVSVSQCTNLGPHNGRTDFDFARDNMLNSFDNRAIVWSAGNDNSWRGYRKGSISAGNTDSFTFQMSNGRAIWYQNHGWSILGPLWLDIWYLGPELDYRVTSGTDNSGWQTAGLPDYNGTLNTRSVSVERDIEQSGGMLGIRLYVSDARDTDVFTIELRNPHATDPANYHAWSGFQGWWADLSGFTQDETTMNDTGCGKSVLTVGACAKILPNPNPATAETITDYSGAGPTVDGRIKPEIVAVGGTFGTPTNTAPEIISTNSDKNSGYTNMVGTSMATPEVAGAVALLFDAYSQLGFTLNQDTIKAILTQNANRSNLHIDPAKSNYVATERNRYGYGRLRMLQAIDLLQPPTTVDVWIRTAPDDSGLQPYPGGCFCISPDIRVCIKGTDTEVTEINWGREYDVKVTVRNLGTANANNTTVRLKYTLPWTAPNDWVEAKDRNNQALVQTANIPAMDENTLIFKWLPDATQFSNPSNTTHYCMLAEADQQFDPLVFSAPTMAGGDAWSTNIKGTNNVALKNLCIK